MPKVREADKREETIKAQEKVRNKPQARSETY
jgi:hypothetical protein